jgi:hypothetical protein
LTQNLGTPKALKAHKTRIGKLAVIWFGGLSGLFVVSIILGLFDNTTELPSTSTQDGLMSLSWLVAGLAALVSIGMTIWQVTGVSVTRGTLGALCGGAFGFLAVFMTFMSLAGIVSGWIDFPPGKTRTYPALLLISRAYQTHGKGHSWNIQTQPVWSNLDITEDDYSFMLAHRRPGDGGKDPDEISSRGYFCARVTIQQAGEARRVMHAGRQKLPEGSVIICPPTTGNGSPSWLAFGVSWPAPAPGTRWCRRSRSRWT